jgi:hypothetical protein
MAGHQEDGRVGTASGSSMGITGASGNTAANTTANQTLKLQTGWSATGQTMHCSGTTLETITAPF